MRQPIYAILFASALTVAACGSSQAPASTPKTPAGRKVDAATAGAITGKVTFTGTPPARETVRVNSDPACLQALGSNTKSESVLVAPDGGVQNAFVYVKDTLSDYAFDVPTAAVTLAQKDCRYEPRVFGVRVGQGLDIINNDATLHNVHALPMVNSEFNKGQPVQGSHMTQVFTAPEVMVRFKCDVHGWMASYGGVMTHPFFAVTTADGAFSIKGLPPGTYELAVWHEKFGTTSQTVKIDASQTQTANFTLAAK